MSDINPVDKWLWNNQVHANRVPYGSIPIGGGEQVPAEDRRSPESFNDGAEPYISWSDPPKPPAKKRGRPKKAVAQEVSE